jgi:dipeptidyl aminopeptidase/acylaminoacyl peptidase
MMKTVTRLLFVIFVPFTTLGLVTKSKYDANSDPPAISSPVTIERWLVLGPVVDPLPLFHDEKAGGFDLKARLDAGVFPPTQWQPEEGAVESWFAGRQLSWDVRSANGNGLVELDVPDGAANGRPAAAWLAAYVEVDRFHSLELEIIGSHARRVWLDGQSVASGGLDGNSEVKQTIKLITGRHLLLIEALWDPSKDDDWTVGATFAKDNEDADVGVSLSLEPERGITIKDITDAPTISSVALSPDGRLVAAALGRYLPGTDDRETWIEVRAAEDGALMDTWRGGFGMGQVAWAPVGHQLSYVTSEGSGDARKSNLWLADLDANTVSPLLERISDFTSYRWSPDGRMIAYLTAVKPKPDTVGIKRLESIRDRWADYRTKNYLNIVLVPGRAHRRLTAGPLTTSATAFSPDAKKLLLTRSLEDVAAPPFGRTELWEMDLESFEPKLLREFRWLGDASYSPDGERILVQGSAQEFGDIGVNVPQGMISNSYDSQLFIWNPATDQVEAITQGFDPAVNAAVWSRADGNIYLTAQDRDYVRLYRYDVSRATFSPLDVGFDSFGSLELALNALVAAGTGTSPWTPQGLVTVDLSSGSSRVVDRPGQEWFSHVRSGTIEPWDFQASSGKTIEGRIYLPPRFDRSRRYPAIVYYYGGTSPTSRSFGGRYPKEYWASQGYVVYTLQPSGATGFGQAFSAVHVNDWGKTTSEEIIEGTRKFLDAHPYVDPARVGCIGASYGGFMTMLLTTKTDVFAGCVAHAGISSLASYWGEGYWGYSYSSVATAGSYPWNRRDIYVDQSPLFRADQHRVPILLTHGADDTNVPVGESDQFYIALKLLGKDVEYLQVAGQNHWIVDHGKRIDWSRSIVAWFDKWLKDQPEWWEDMYPEQE